jgi:hypothetical protein
MTAAAVTIALALAGAASAWTQATAKPVLRVAGPTLFGSHFKPRERVKVTFSATRKHIVYVKTTAAGFFSTPLGPYDSCRVGYTITAVGALGDRATMRTEKRKCLPK